jgi:ketosteroid isomerase-like protein
MDLKQLARTYFSTFSKQDLDGLEEMFDDDVVLKDWDIEATGKMGVLAANKKIFDSVESIIVTPISMYQENNTVVAEISIVVNGREHLFVVDVLTFFQDKIVGIRAYKG